MKSDQKKKFLKPDCPLMARRVGCPDFSLGQIIQKY
jgi:hypothetical protein